MKVLPYIAVVFFGLVAGCLSVPGAQLPGPPLTPPGEGALAPCPGPGPAALDPRPADDMPALATAAEPEGRPEFKAPSAPRLSAQTVGGGSGQAADSIFTGSGASALAAISRPLRAAFKMLYFSKIWRLYVNLRFAPLRRFPDYNDSSSLY